MTKQDKPREWFLYESITDDSDTLTAVPRGDDPYDQYANMITVIEKVSYDKLRAEHGVAIDALKFECGDRCAEQNPCNAKEVLAKIKEVKGE